MSGALLNLPPPLPPPLPPTTLAAPFSLTQTQHVWLHSLLWLCRARSLLAPYSVLALAPPLPLAALPLAAYDPLPFVLTDALELSCAAAVAPEPEPEPGAVAVEPSERTDRASAAGGGRAA